MNKWNNSTIDTYIKYFGKTANVIVYECGSRDGHDAVDIAERISTGHVDHSNLVLFDCDPRQIEDIRLNYPDATIITDAISDVSGKEVEFLQIHGDKNFVGSSTMNTARNDSWIKETSTIKVKTRRLDEVIEELGHQDTQIDIMKIDIEGYTAEALRSLGKYLRNVRVYHLETEPEGYARAETNLDIALFMEKNGYLCTDLQYEWGPSIQDQVWVRLDNV